MLKIADSHAHLRAGGGGARRVPLLLRRLRGVDLARLFQQFPQHGAVLRQRVRLQACQLLRLHQREAHQRQQLVHRRPRAGVAESKAAAAATTAVTASAAAVAAAAVAISAAGDSAVGVCAAAAGVAGAVGCAAVVRAATRPGGHGAEDCALLTALCIRKVSFAFAVVLRLPLHLCCSCSSIQMDACAASYLDDSLYNRDLKVEDNIASHFAFNAPCSSSAPGSRG